MWFEQAIEVIPAVDVLGEGAVRLERGDYGTVVERGGAPVALARRWAEAGAGRIHLVDLDGARNGGVRPALVRAVAEVGLPVQSSGGIRSLEDARSLLEAGAHRGIVGTPPWPGPPPRPPLGGGPRPAPRAGDGGGGAAGVASGAG